MAYPDTHTTPVETMASAYLFVREEGAWGDMYRLPPHQVSTIGRSPTNKIVLRDEMCSRNHCEIFQSDDTWIVRDLNSRNGTFIANNKLEGDIELDDGDVIQIGACRLRFQKQLTIPEEPDDVHETDEAEETDTRIGVGTPDGQYSSDTKRRKPKSPTGSDSAPEILSRKKEHSFAEPKSKPDAKDLYSVQLSRLYQLGFDMGSAADPHHLSEVVLNGIIKDTAGEIGAVLLSPIKMADDPKPEQLSVIAYVSPQDQPYQRLSDSLSQMVLKEKEAVLANDVNDDSNLSTRDSLGEIRAKSVICCPIRMQGRLAGLIHLYSTNPDNPLDENDLEYCLAVADQLGVALNNLVQKKSLADGLAKANNDIESLRRKLHLETDLVGESQPIQQLQLEIKRIATTDAIILVRGESGVGKELVARAIHYNSMRKSNQFVCMNCAALSETLLESELFGHEKGSFTGATARKIGKFEQAHKGTIFLDEVGEMSPSIQAKFLRVLEGHPFERVGGSSPIKVDVRVVAATNRDLEEAVKSGDFRKDLYFRLHVVEILVPPLSARRSDIPILASHFVKRLAEKTGRNAKTFSIESNKKLTNYDWPGNVRELKHAVERAFFMSDQEIIQADDIRFSSLEASEPAQTKPELQETASPEHELSLEDLERRHILTTLEQTGWNKSKTSQILGIERSTLDRKLKKYNVTRPES